MSADVGRPKTHVHQELHTLRSRLAGIHASITTFEPLSLKPPILDSSVETGDSSEESQWLRQENIPGLKMLRELVYRDLEVLEKFLADPECVFLPPPSTNAPYLIAIWQEVLCAPPSVVSICKTFSSRPRSIPSARKGGAEKLSGVKVDVVADNGRQWIRVNTVKNSRLLAEFREIDSYMTGSDDDSDDDPNNEHTQSLAPTEFDNSILRMGRSLLAASKENIIPGTLEPPRVVMRLTRLDASPIRDNGEENDPRIAKTIQCLHDMGLEVRLGERDSVPLHIDRTSSLSADVSPEPTKRVNLDLSVLIALVSDLTHSSLPKTAEEARQRFIPPQSYREWRRQRPGIFGTGKAKYELQTKDDEAEDSETRDDVGKHSRQLTYQVLQEMGRGLIQEIFDRLSISSTSAVEFWTTPEARERCLRIASKIGGPNEKRRANALFPSSFISSEEAEDKYWQDSRYPRTFIPLLPIHLFTSSDQAQDLSTQPQHSPSPYCRTLAKTCTHILKQETIPHPRALPSTVVEECAQIQRATVTKANPRLTAHTVESMLRGAEMGWTTLTANKASVKALVREVRAGKLTGRDDGDVNEYNATGKEMETAAIWIVDPRSLAEGMRGDYET